MSPQTQLDDKNRGTSHGLTDGDEWLPIQVYDPEFVSAVQTELDALAHLQPDWDAYGAPRIDLPVIDAAKTFVSRLPESVAKRPSVVPLSTGKLQFEWHDGPRSLELEIEDPQTVRYLKWDPEERIEDEGTFSIDEIDCAATLLRWYMRGTANV